MLADAELETVISLLRPMLIGIPVALLARFARSSKGSWMQNQQKSALTSIVALTSMYTHASCLSSVPSGDVPEALEPR